MRRPCEERIQRAQPNFIGRMHIDDSLSQFLQRRASPESRRQRLRLQAAIRLLIAELVSIHQNALGASHDAAGFQLLLRRIQRAFQRI